MFVVFLGMDVWTFFCYVGISSFGCRYPQSDRLWNHMQVFPSLITNLLHGSPLSSLNIYSNGFYSTDQTFLLINFFVG